MPDLAQTTFITGPEDDLAVVDIYKESGASGTINSIQDYFDSFDKESIGKFLRGGKAVLKLLPAISKLSKLNIKKLDTRALIGQLGNVSTNLSNAVKTLPDGQMKTVLGEVAKGSELVTRSTSGVLSKIPYGNLNNNLGIFNAITAIAPDVTTSFTDDPTIRNAVVGITKAANSTGIRGALTPILASGKFDASDVLRIANSTLPSVIKNSDLQSLKALAEKTLPGEVSKLYRDTLKDFSSSYVKPFACTLEDANKEYLDINASFSAIEPNWNKLMFGGVELPNIQAISKSSEDFKSVVKIGAMLAPEGSDEKFNLFTTEFKIPSIEETVTEMFPNTLVSEITPSFSLQNPELRDTEQLSLSVSIDKRISLIEEEESLKKQQQTLLSQLDWNNPVEAATINNQLETIKFKLVDIQKQLSNS